VDKKFESGIRMELNGKYVLVVGLGKSGVASALFLKAHGARVTVSDTKSGDELRNEIPVLLDHGITVETGGHGERTFRGQDLIVVSPGVPVDAPPLVQARGLGESVIGEIELAAQFLPGPIVAITGSNGKTTTTTLVGEILTVGDCLLWLAATSAHPRSRWPGGRNLRRSLCWKFPAFNWKRFRLFVRKWQWCSMSRRIISTGTARLRSTRTRRRAFLKTSREATLRF